MLRQEVGHRAALKVTADADPIPAAEVLALVEPNRLAWCVARLHGGGVELRWHCRGLRPCGHEVVIEHRCPAGVREHGRRPEGGLW
ncbi:hypothetical protein [Streptomyces sp. NPDC091215]|uniref:hypothetical protein n=1 Tax=Streptomyces sp. NPDC091215 TaxID=3155192 RepID=UPI003429F30B